MKVEKKYLLIIAGFVWLIAGTNITEIGLQANDFGWKLYILIGAVIVYLIFHNMVFRKMVKKHTARICSYPDEKQSVFRFFDKQAYLIMAFMMTMGIGLRQLNVLPKVFINVFYSGLGVSLMIAGISFFINYFRYNEQLRKAL